MRGYVRSISYFVRIGICILIGSLLMHGHQVSAAEPSLQQIFDEYFGSGIIDTTKETGRTSFPLGTYTATYVARYTTNTQAPIGSYPVGRELERLFMFDSTDTPPKKVTRSFSTPWALWIDTNGNQNNGRWRSEYWWNTDGADHYKTYDIPWGGYAVGIEDVPGAVDGDFQDHVLMFETGPRPPPKKPLILIPGIMGSEFEVKETFDPDIRNCFFSPVKYEYTIGDKIWLDLSLSGITDNKTCGRYLDVLKLKSDGQTAEYPQVDLKHTITDTPYRGTIDYLSKKEQGYEKNKNLFIFPYDWRRDVSFSMSGLDTMIDRILATASAGTKVQILAHSMGGMLTHQYISDAQRAQKVDTLVELGTPHVGTPTFLAHLLYDKCVDSGIFGISCIIHGHEVNTLVQNFTGAFELLPSKQYFQLYPDTVPFRDDRDIDDNRVTGSLDYSQLKTLLSNTGKNMQVFGTAESFHDSLDPTYTHTNGVKIYTIAGSGYPTIGQIRDYAIYSVFSDSGAPRAIKAIKQDAVAINGDRTVPLKSVTLNNPGNVYYVKQKHGDLPTGTSLTLAVNLLNGKTNAISGIQTEPFGFSGAVIGIYSPVRLHAYDSQGNHTGPTNDDGPQENIPGSFYDELGETKYIYLPDGGEYRITTQATGEGVFDLKIKTYEEAALTKETLFLNVVQTEHTTTSMTLGPDAPVLVVDKNNDGNPESHLMPTSIVTGNALTDSRAPETTIQADGTKGDDGWFRSDVTVTIHAQDEQSAILRTEYVLDDGNAAQPYTQPFVIKKEGKTKILYYSTDKMGNTEKPKEMEISVDKTPPEISVAFDPELKKLLGKGEDALSGIKMLLQTDTAITAQDTAGNTVQLDITTKKENAEKRKGSHTVSASVLRYNEQAISIPETKLSVSWKTNKNEVIDHLEQTFVIKDVQKIHAVYTDNRDTSTVIEKTSGEKKEKSKVQGMKIVMIKSNDGNLSMEIST